MARSLEDDLRRRMEAADRAVSRKATGETEPEPPSEQELPEEETEEESPEVAVQMNVWLKSRDLRRKALSIERDLARNRMRRRVRVAFAAISLSCALAGAGWTAAVWGSHERVVRGGIVCGALVLLFVVAALSISPTPPGSGATAGTVAGPEDELERIRDDLQILGAFRAIDLRERRHLYRESVADLIEQYRAESRRHRRVHNSLQVLVMTGSAGSTTVAALDWGQQPTWQGITLTVISFAITLASAFTGYYKYRERSYFLQQTADSIEEELNALMLGVGEYTRFGDDEKGALALFTKRVEGLRNEQRRRQQQLDQPAERAEPESRPQG